jgi:hypothetical protein
MHFTSDGCMHLDMDASTETNLDMDVSLNTCLYIDVSLNTCLYIDVSQDTHLFMYKGGRRRRMHSSHWPGFMSQGRGLGHAGSLLAIQAITTIDTKSVIQRLHWSQGDW